ncbi:hypothetical protein CHS0354_002802 [Potamilus streckersoni]|uniref:BTB domain-containing protein n=1 Tax=Potamilus streckersoni TaxID=2493646 RepID=A0AAE0S7M7_9BIVA|nr:hypothetical protein CHS0354_002802 [Potamilus streckersoni]
MEKVFVNTDHRPQLVSQLSSLWRCKKYCDAVIHQGSSCFELHKIVLFASCPNALKQLMHTEDNNVFDFYLTEEFEDLSVNAFLSYLYDGTIQLNQDNVEGLERIAKKLKLLPLLRFCQEFWNMLEGQAGFQRQILSVQDQRVTALQSSFKPAARENLHTPDSTTNIVTISEAPHEERGQASSTIVTPSNGTSSLKKTLELTDIQIKIEPEEMEEDVLYLGPGPSKVGIHTHAKLTGSKSTRLPAGGHAKVSASRTETAPNSAFFRQGNVEVVSQPFKAQPVKVEDIQDLSGTGLERDIFGIESLGSASLDDLAGISDTVHLNAFDTSYRTVKRRRTNNHYSPEIRAEIGKYALEHGNTKAAKKYSKELNMSVGESTVRSFKKQYLDILKSSKGEINELMKARRGRPLVLGDLNQEVADLIYRIKEAGGVINQDIVIETAQRVAKQHHNLDSLHIAKMNKSWATSFLKGLGFVNIGEKSPVKTVPFQEFESHRQNFVSLVKAVAQEKRIPKELTINFHQVSLNMIPVSDWTHAASDASQITNNDRFDGPYKVSLLVATSASGTFLPPQVIYDNQAKHECSIDFPDTWDVLSTENHQPTEDSMIQYINKILIPYTKKTKTDLEFSDTKRAMAIFHIHPQICSKKVQVTLETARIDHVFVPNNFLEELQPVTLSVVAPVQAGLKESFMNWYSNEVAAQLLHSAQGSDGQENKTGMSIDLSIQTLKPLHAEWLVRVIQNLENVKDLILSGWSISGTLDVLE